MLGAAPVIAFVPTCHPEKARAFYETVLGLQFVSEDPFALVFGAHGVTVRVVNVSSVRGFKPAPFTILGWQVPDAAQAVRQLRARGVKFQRFPGMAQNRAAIWASPSGAQVAWFKDPDGNILSITQA